MPDRAVSGRILFKGVADAAGKAVTLILTIVAIGYHSALGVQVVIEDYVGGKGARAATLVASTLAHWGLAIAAVFAVLRVAFGS